MDLQLKGHKVLITGATKGIGRATAASFASEGADVAICARNQEDIDAAVEALSSKGVKAFGLAVDAMQAESLKGWIDASAEALGGIDCIVSNVTGGGGEGDDASRSQFEGHVLGAVRCLENSMPYLENSDNASVVMISSTAALEKFMGPRPYNATKAALIQYSGALSQELAPKGIRVNTISPGPIMIEGGAWDNIKQHMTPFYEATLADIPCGRMGKAEEIADQIVFLASQKGAFTTGTNIVIDGGLTKRIQF